MKLIELNVWHCEKNHCSKCGKCFPRFKNERTGEYLCADCAGKDSTLFGECYFNNDRTDMWTIARHECRDDVAKEGLLCDFDKVIWYCDPKQFHYKPLNLHRAWYLVEHKFDWDWDSEWDEAIAEIKYCPFCGKKLEVPDGDEDSKRNVEDGSDKTR